MLFWGAAHDAGRCFWDPTGDPHGPTKIKNWKKIIIIIIISFQKMIFASISTPFFWCCVDLGSQNQSKIHENLLKSTSTSHSNSNAFSTSTFHGFGTPRNLDGKQILENLPCYSYTRFLINFGIHFRVDFGPFSMISRIQRVTRMVVKALAMSALSTIVEPRSWNQDSSWRNLQHEYGWYLKPNESAMSATSHLPWRPFATTDWWATAVTFFVLLGERPKASNP